MHLDSPKAQIRDAIDLSAQIAPVEVDDSESDEPIVSANFSGEPAVRFFISRAELTGKRRKADRPGDPAIVHRPEERFDRTVRADVFRKYMRMVGKNLMAHIDQFSFRCAAKPAQTDGRRSGAARHLSPTRGGGIFVLCFAVPGWLPPAFNPARNFDTAWA